MKMADFLDKVHEECGVFGIYSNERSFLAPKVYYGLYALQHRGQESCGIAVNDSGVFRYYKDTGLVSEVFTNDIIGSLGQSQMAVGHVRYGTTGSSDRANAQPIVINHNINKMATVHNGNLTNAVQLREKIKKSGAIFQTTSDTEVISFVVSHALLESEDSEKAVLSALGKLDGAYSLIFMFRDKLVAARDRHGYRPLCYGKCPDGSFVIASETCALDAVDASFVRDILPGEMVVFDSDGVRSDKSFCFTAKEAMCIFEYIYFARPDSKIDGYSVHNARLRAGEFLAKEHPADADVVVGVPDSGIDAAIGYSRYSGIPYGIGFIKNKYIGRTFISPGQKSREDKVRIKLNPVFQTVSGKRVVLVDDSIVRGTTSARIVKLLKDAGALEVHVRITAPPFMHPCYYGTDIDSRENLIACKHTVDEIRDIIGADSLGFLNTGFLSRLPSDDMAHGYCTACFTGVYDTDIPLEREKDRIES